jgi:3-oxoacyl-[acyl-carrier protein] reductase
MAWGGGEQTIMGTVIFGATGGVGEALARRLTQRGRPVWLLGRDAGRLEQLANELSAGWSVVDLATSAGVIDAVNEANDRLGGLSSLVNCVGSVLLKAAHLTSDEEFQETIEVNLSSSFRVVKAAASVLRERGGSVVLFASAAAEVGIMNHEAIAAAKAGVIGLARSAAATYAPRNIRFNVISPGLVKSKMTSRIWQQPAAAASSLDLHALGRFGEPEQIASLAEWLITPENDWITGQVIGVDGGLGHVLPRRKA